MKKQLISAVLCVSSLSSISAFADGISVEISNLTHGVYFTPLLVATHDRDTHLFQSGHDASANLQAMAEGGEISGLIGELEAAGGKYVADPAGGLLGPGSSASAVLDTHRRHGRYLSVVAMMLPTNDGFIGLDAQAIPHRKGTYTYYLNGYDAGTEGNDEVINGGGMPNVPGIPAAPGGDGGSGASGVVLSDTNTRIHIHRGNLGDTDPVGGISDVDSRIHRWLNPVAKVVVTVH